LPLAFDLPDAFRANLDFFSILRPENLISIKNRDECIYQLKIQTKPKKKHLLHCYRELLNDRHSLSYLKSLTFRYKC